LLDAFAGDVSGDGDILVGFADFVQFVDVDDALLGGFDVVFGGLEESEEDIFDIFADVAGFGEGGGVADGEGDVEGGGEGAGEEGFAAACGSDKQDVGFFDFDVFIGAEGVIEAFIVVVDGDGDGFFGVVLSDNVLVEDFFNLAGRGGVGEEVFSGTYVPSFLADDVGAEVDTIGADEDASGSFDEGSDVAFVFTAKAAGSGAFSGG